MSTVREVEHHIQFPAHRWQQHLTNSRARDRALCAGIRGGKTTWGSMAFLREMTTGPPGVGLISGPDLLTLKQTALETIMYGMGPRHLGKWPEELIALFHRTDNRIELHDGNKILVRGADKPDALRGPAAKAWWLDEASICKRGTLSILQGRTLDTGGRGIVTGTPKGKRNWLYDEILAKCTEVIPGRVWKGERWEVVVYPSRENPGLDPAEVDALGRQYSERMRQQELEARLVDWGGAVFLSEALDRCLGQPSHWGERLPGHSYRAGLDPAGQGQDYTVLTVVCASCRALVDIWRCQRLPFRAMYAEVEQRMAHWQPAVLRLDATSMGGQAVFEEVEARLSIVSPTTACEDFVFTRKTKVEAYLRLASRLEEGIAIPLSDATSPVAHELRGYEWDDDGLVTDCVQSLALAVYDLPPRDMEVEGVGPRFGAERPTAGMVQRIVWDDIP